MTTYPSYLAKLFQTQIFLATKQEFDVVEQDGSLAGVADFVSIYDMNTIGFRALNGLNITAKEGDIVIHRCNTDYHNKWILPLSLSNNLINKDHVYYGYNGKNLDAAKTYIFRHAWSPYSTEFGKAGSAHYNLIFDEFIKKEGFFGPKLREPSVGNVNFSEPLPLP